MTTAAVLVPDNPDDFADALLDNSKRKAIVEAYGGGPDALKKFAKDYSAKLHASNADTFKAQVAEQAQIALADLLAKNGVDTKRGPGLDFSADGSEPPTARKGSFTVRNPQAIGAPLNGVAPSLAHYIQAVWKHQNPNVQPDAAQREMVSKVLAYQEKVPDQGGFLVPEEFRTDILQMSLSEAIVRPRARVFPMSSATLSIPTVDETTRVGSVYGGVVVYRTEEGAELTASDAKFGRIKFEASKQTALGELTNELMKDVPALGAWVDQNIPGALADAEDDDYIGGNGAGEPLGMLHANNTALLTISKETSQTASTIVLQNVLKMMARFKGSWDRAIWIASPDALVEIYTMGLTVGTGGSAIMISPGGGTGRLGLTLFGAPLIFTEKAPAGLGTKGDLSLVDPLWYGIGDRQAVTVETSAHVKFTSDKTVIRAIARNDGRPLVLSPLTPKNNTATLSPFVTLETRS